MERLAAGRQTALTAQRDRIFSAIPTQRHSRVLDADARSGLLLWEALRRAPEGGVWGLVRAAEDAAVLEHRMHDLETTVRPTVLMVGSSLAETAASLPPGAGAAEALAALGIDQDIRFEFVVGRNLFTRLSSEQRSSVLRLLLSLLAPGGRLSVAEVVPGMAQRLSALIDTARAANGAKIVEKLQAAEERAYHDASNPLVSWGPEDLARAAREAGAADARVELECYTEVRRITAKDLDAWLSPGSSYGRAVAEAMSPADRDDLIRLLHGQFEGKEIGWSSFMAFLVGRNR
jgi:putative ATPase